MYILYVANAKKKKNNNDNKLTKRNEKTITPLHY